MAFGLYLRTIIFGITDSLVSTVGLLAGIDVAGADHHTIALTGLVYAFVEAFSMAIGNYLSEESVEEFAAKSEVPIGAAVSGGIVMFVSFIVAALIPLAPYLIFANTTALAISVIASVVALFVLGMASASFARLPLWTRGLRMALLGGAAIVVGVIVGVLVPAA